MTSHLEALQQRKDAAVSLAHKVALHTSRSADKIVVVESGDDFYFYSALATRCVPETNFQFFSGGRRRSVIETIKALKLLGKEHRCFGIVDRDFHFDDPEIIEDRILVIDVYSFENYFGNEKDIINIGRSFFALEPGENLNEWLEYTKRFLSTLPSAFAHEHAVALACFRNDIKCTLSNVNYDHIVSIDRDGSVKTIPGSSVEFRKKCGVDEEKFEKLDFLEYTKEIESSDWRRVIRGHYFWDCFVKMINIFRSTLDEKFVLSRTSRSRTKSELNSRHILEAATSHITPPATVTKFLRELAQAQPIDSAPSPA